MKALAVLFLCLLSTLARGEERVLDFHSRIVVSRDGGLTVTETIAVQVEGQSIKRGIQRDFPTDYRDRSGASVKVPFEVVAVTQDGQPAQWQTMAMANGVRTRIGNPNVMLSRGRHVYEITYRTSRQLGFFKEHDELYWNVNGNGWTFPFDALSAQVVLPQGVEASRLRLEAYTGFFGDRGRHYEAAPTASGAEFRATRRLAAGEGLTIVVGFPKGLVIEPTLATRLRWWLADNRGVAAGLAGFALLVAFLGWQWTLVGRDPREGPRFPRYDPPPGVGPAGARYVDRMDYDDRCFAAGLVGLAQRGFLRIRQRPESYTIERTGTSVDYLPGEKRLAEMVPGKPLVIGATHDPLVQMARDSFKAELAARFGGRLFSKNRGSLAVGILIALLTGGAMFALDAPLLFLFLGGAALVATLVLFARWLPAYSIEGRKLQDAIEGLRQYMSVADADELRRMKAPPQTKEEFARLLPYALALDVEKTWTDRFAAALGAAAVAAAVQDYYQSDSGSFGSGAGPARLAESISSLGGTIASAATPPGSSSGFSDSGGGGGSSSGGGGGGGSSGGGGGGGGGSGW